MTALVVAETVVLALVVLLVAGLLRSHAEVLRRLEGLTGSRTGVTAPSDRAEAPPAPDRPIDAMAPDVTGETLDGDPVRIGVGAGGRDTLLAFLSSGCLTCQAFWEALGPGRQGRVPGEPRIAVVTKNRTSESPSRLRELAPPGVPVVMSSAAWEAYEVPVSPYFVLVDGARGTVRGEGTAERWDQIVSLLRDALEDADVAARARANGDRDGGRDGRNEQQTPRRPARRLRSDLELRDASIGPGHPSLYQPGDPRRDA